MKPVPHLSEAEWEVMKLIWRRASATSTASELAAELAGPTGWSESTVKTLLNRLLKKGALSFEKLGKSYLYFPVIAEEECRSAATDSFLNRVFDGSLSPLLAHFVSSQKLSVTEIGELERLLEKTKQREKRK
jgi:BlaI family transcriptional regulator, penicillinase repressor